VKAKAPAKKVEDPLFKKNPRSFRIGGAIRHTTDLSRFVRWPRYVRIQRQKKVLMQRLKVPPSIDQFTRSLDKNQATELFKLLVKMAPETKAEKKERLTAVAGGAAPSKPKPTVKFGLNHVTDLVEQKKAKLVVIAHDVDPIELVVWLPALCRKMDVPYCIVRGKARLGALVHQKNAAVVALTEVSAADKHKLDSLTTAFKAQYNDNVDAIRQWGGGLRGLKSQAKLDKRAAAVAAERK